LLGAGQGLEGGWHAGFGVPVLSHPGHAITHGASVSAFTADSLIAKSLASKVKSHLRWIGP